MIPKKFKLGAKTIKIKMFKDIDDNGQGRSYAYLNLIKLAKTVRGHKPPKSEIERTLYHEVVHLILTEYGYHNESGDEKIVEALAMGMMQFEKTKK